MTSVSVAPPTRITAFAGEFCQPLLQLLSVVVRGGLLDLRLDLGDAVLDVLLLTGAVDDRGILFFDHHLLGFTQHGKRDVLELMPRSSLIA